MVITLIVVCIWSVVTGVRDLRRNVQRDILPHKRQLEALLGQLDEER